MEVERPCEEEENAELLRLCEVRAALAWYKELREADWGGRKGKLPKPCMKPSPLSGVFAAGHSHTWSRCCCIVLTQQLP